MKEEFLHKKLQERKDQNAYRQLTFAAGSIDFCSNDYLGIVKNRLLDPGGNQHSLSHGSTGSRLLSGNSVFAEETEDLVASFHRAECGLLYNSGYDANVGLLSCIPQRGDTILYDHLCHASIRDGIRLSFANAMSFQHNDLTDLEHKLEKASGNIFVVTESVFSMDGDLAPLTALSGLCSTFHAYLIVDEAHATGVIGDKGEGLVQYLHLQSKCFARIHTFGKAVGCHGAIVLGSAELRNYLINFSRPFIYSTALPLSSIHAIRRGYDIFPTLREERVHLQNLVSTFSAAPIRHQKLFSTTPIQGVVVPGNQAVKSVAMSLQENNLDVRPILYPSVPKGAERLRIVLHSFNTNQDLDQLITILNK